MLLDNQSSFAAIALSSFTANAEDVAVVVARASFDLPRRSGDPPRLRYDQPAIPLVDTYRGEPGRSSLSVVGQSSYRRPGTDVYIHGCAWAPRGRPSDHVEVAVRVGPLERRALVFGPRRFVAQAGQLVPSAPEPFERIPLIYEHAFGGPPELVAVRDRQLAEHNPVGRGLYACDTEARGQLLPNIEDPSALITSSTDRPDPLGFGPIPCHWLPRRSYAGTYDESWLTERAPLWPKDMNERLFCAAAPGLSTHPRLVGGEAVALQGLHPDGTLRFVLPRIELVLDSRATAASTILVLDAVTIDCDDWRLDLTWRACHASPNPTELGLRQNAEIEDAA